MDQARESVRTYYELRDADNKPYPLDSSGNMNTLSRPLAESSARCLSDTMLVDIFVWECVSRPVYRAYIEKRLSGERLDGHLEPRANICQGP
jgi:hypothetical protein